MSALAELDVLVAAHEGLSRTVLQYTRTLKDIVDRAEQPGFTSDEWGPLGALVDAERFERVGPFKDAMSWSEYVEFLTAWATTSYWECTFKRITETGYLVFLELEERMAPGDTANAVNSLSVYELADDGLIRHLDVYLQMAWPPAAG
ncbi:MAG: hypothetical protein ACXWA3_06730 [Acidimicrobiales bacterium]